MRCRLAVVVLVVGGCGGGHSPALTSSLRAVVSGGVPGAFAAVPDGERTRGAFRYSSTNYLVLGLIIERVTGQSLVAELRDRIFAPLHLADTAYVAGAIRTPHLHGYSLPSHQGVVDTSAEPRDLEGRSARW